MPTFPPLWMSLLLALPIAAQRPARPPATPPAGDAFAKLRQQYDKDGDGKIQKAEYPRADAGFANLDRDGNGIIEAGDFTAATPRGRRAAVPMARKTDKLPKAGEMAPDFELPMLGMKDTTVKLSSFRGDRPVALIFGSYT